jgi:hypothetical protein
MARFGRMQRRLDESSRRVIAHTKYSACQHTPEQTPRWLPARAGSFAAKRLGSGWWVCGATWCHSTPGRRNSARYPRIPSAAAEARSIGMPTPSARASLTEWSRVESLRQRRSTGEIRSISHRASGQHARRRCDCARIGNLRRAIRRDTSMPALTFDLGCCTPLKSKPNVGPKNFAGSSSSAAPVHRAPAPGAAREGLPVPARVACPALLVSVYEPREWEWWVAWTIAHHHTAMIAAAPAPQDVTNTHTPLVGTIPHCSHWSTRLLAVLLSALRTKHHGRDA